jgi:hypothetical protein
VVDDGSHNGLIFRTCDAPVRPDPTSPITLPNTTHLEIGFSDRGWIRRTGSKLGHVVRILGGKGQGVVVLSPHSSLESAIGTREVVCLHLSDFQIEQVQSAIRQWISGEGPIEVLKDHQLTFSIPSTKQYTFFRNCRTFTARVLSSLNHPNLQSNPPR